MLNSKKDILATLTYFNMFDYPLRKREIFIFLGASRPMRDFEGALAALLVDGAIFKIGEFYSLTNNHTLAERRIKGNNKAAILLKQAERSASIISSFPFVKGVAVSGSLSKNFASEDADIDFFIITAANRLWLSRTFLHLFKKFTFLFGRQHFFCMNYFIDEAEPVILEKNIYTATEVSTILPLRGNAVFNRFYAANSWTKTFLPNNYMHVSAAKELKPNWLKRSLEWLLNNQLGNGLDTLFMRMTARSWGAKTRHQRRDNKEMLLSLHTGKHFAKPNPVQFQKRILLRYENSLAEIMEHYESTGRLKNEWR